MMLLRIATFLLVSLAFEQLRTVSAAERVRLSDIQVLTLYDGKSTTARRGSPIPQLKCVGGTASGKFIPKVVQCYNRGSDGNDVQWECKTDMDNDYRFGSIEVSCEGYDYPEDPYILKGSCGLEYTLDYTKQGHAKQQDSNYGYSNSYGSSQQYSYQKSSHGFKLADLVFLGMVGLIIYGVYRTCISSNRAGATGYDSDDRPRDDGRGPYPNDSSGPRFRGNNPPPPGFKPEYKCDDTYTSQPRTQTHHQQQPQGGLGGFWTGMGAGGLLGYLFGRGNTGYGHAGYGGYHQPYYGGGRGFWGGGGSYTTYQQPTSSFSSSSNSSFSTGTRTASGFGGTKRR